MTNEIAHYGAGVLVPHNMDEAIRLAEFMARARTVPKHLWDSPGDCLMVVELAMRWGMSPFAVAQATSVISGKQMIEGKLVAAAVENSGAIVGQFDYDFAGEGEERSIIIKATRRGETNPRTVTVKLADAKTANVLWVKQPDQQLVYHGVRVWARRWTPAVILGVYSREEMGPVIEGELVAAEASPEREAINDAVPMKAAALDMKRGARIAEKAPAYEGGKAPPAARTDEQWRVWLGKLRDACAVLYHRSEVVELAERGTVSEALATGPEWVQREISAILADHYKRFPEEPDLSDEALGDVQIEGESKVLAGD